MGKNYVYLTLAELAGKVVTFIAIANLARVVGPTAYGYFEFAAAALFCAGLIVDQGLGPYGAREIARAPARTGELVSEIVALRFVLALITMVLVVGFALGFAHSVTVTQLLLIYALDLLVMPLLLQWVFQGHDQMSTVAVLQIIRQALFAVVVLVAVRDSAQIWLAAVAEGIGILGAALYGMFRYYRHFRRGIELRFKLSTHLLRESLPIGLSQIFWVVRMYGAILIVGLIAPPQQVGYFGAAMRLFVALHAFIYLYLFNLLPSMARTWQQRDSSFEKLIGRSMWLVGWCCLPLVTLWVILAPNVVTAVYGPQFLPGGLALAWLGLAFGAAWLDGHYRFGLIAAGRQDAEMMSQLLGAVVAVLLIPLLYAGFGLGGVGLALFLSELAVWAAAWGFVHTRLHLREQTDTLMRPFIGSVLAAVVFWLMSSTALLERIVVILCVLGAFMGLVAPQLRALLVEFLLGQILQLRERIDQLVRWHLI